MDKNTYETYEYLPTNNSEAEPDQFFVVQDDGTFLLNRQVQYVAQVEDVKEVLNDVQPCTVYGVSSQQFFVDVDNSAELISVSDQFILPDGDNSLYTNSYLLQPSSSTTTEQMDEDVVVDQFKQQTNTQHVDIDVVTHNSKQGNNFTEITLSDEQYQTLEQKGWILLESNDKIFVLNTLGLHDITTNDKLIQKLKNEIQNGTTETTTINDEGTLKIESVSSQFPSIVTDTLSSQQDMVEFVISEQNEHVDSVQFIVDHKANESLLLPSNKQEPPAETIAPETLTQETYYDKDTSSIKIKTKFNFKDIPEKIILGKTANGKRLVAKVIKPPPVKTDTSKYEQAEENPVFTQISENQHYNVTGLHEADFVNLIQETLRGGVRATHNEQDIASADNVISQLLKVPNLKESLFGQNLIVTKETPWFRKFEMADRFLHEETAQLTIFLEHSLAIQYDTQWWLSTMHNKDEYGTIHNRSKVTLITGRVKETEDTHNFEHIPNLLQTIKFEAEQQNLTQNEEVYSCIEEKEEKESFSIYHVHITETNCHDNVVRVAVTLNKRQLPVNLVFDLKRRYPTTVFGCSACATLFKSEEALKEHQEGQCMGTQYNEDMLTIDSDHSNTDEDVIIMKTGKETTFSCAQCSVKFKKLSNIHRHMKTHTGPNKQILQTDRNLNQNTETKRQPNKIYKCKMCPSIFHHSISLSKHIVNRHIKVKSN